MRAPTRRGIGRKADSAGGSEVLYSLFPKISGRRPEILGKMILSTLPPAKTVVHMDDRVRPEEIEKSIESESSFLHRT